MSLKLIPVIDLMHGCVVQARRGERARYRPLRSCLCASSKPLEVASALLGFHAFDTVYIADLDAILGIGSHFREIQELRQRHPAVDFWVDCGIRDAADLVRFGEQQLGTPVLGTEALCDPTIIDRNDSVLSLDYRQGHLLGPLALDAQPNLWPRRVIAMYLDRVGSAAGPALPALSDLVRRAPGTAIYAAGGVRNAEDLDALRRCGAHGVLLATALHEGQLSPAKLRTELSPPA